MAFKISEIQSAINSANGLAHSAHFLVFITPPGHVGKMDNFVYFCEAASLPGVRFQTSQIKPWHYGVAEKRVVGADQPAVNLTFMCDAKGEVIKFFHKWIQNIFNINPESQNREIPAANNAGYAVNFYEHAYPDEYVGEMQIYVYDTKADEIITYKFTQAYPVAISDVQMSWGAKDEYVKFNIEMNYTHWTTEGFSAGTEAKFKDKVGVIAPEKENKSTSAYTEPVILSA